MTVLRPARARSTPRPTPWLLALLGTLGALASCGGGGGGSSGVPLAWTLPALRVGFALPATAPAVSFAATAYSVSAGALPPGIELDAVTGELSGRPLAAGATLATLEATDGTTTVSADLAFDVELPPASRHALVAAGGAAGTLSALALDAGGGLPRHAGHATAGDTPVAVAVALDGSLAWTANAGSDDVSAFAVDGTGALTEVAGSPFATSADPRDVAVDPLLATAWVLCGAGGSPVVRPHSIAADGALTALPSGPVAAGAAAERILVEPLGRFVYVSFGGAAGMVQSYAVQPTGALVAGAAAMAGDTPAALAATPDGAFLYAANRGSDDVSGYSIDAGTGALAPLGARTALSGGTTPVDLAVTDDGGLLIVSQLGGVVEVFAIAADGSLASRGSLVTGATGAVAVVAGGAQALALDPSADELAPVDLAADGTPSLPTVRRLRLRDAPADVALVPGLAALSVRSEHLYASSAGDDEVHAFALGADGTPNELASSPVATGASPNWAEVHPRLAALYSVNQSGFANSVEVFSLAADGAPTSVQMADQGGITAWSLHFERSGRFAFGINSSPGEVVPWSVAADGTLAANGAAVSLGAMAIPGAAAVDPTGAWLYVPRSGDDLVSQLAIDPGTGLVAPLGTPTVATGSAPISVAVDPTGRFAYVACIGIPDEIRGYAVDSDTGELTELAASPFAVMGQPLDLLPSPDGRFLWAAHFGTADAIETFAIDVDPTNGTEDGALSSIDLLPLLDPPFKLRASASGDRLYASQSSVAGKVATFAVTNGVPSPLDLDAAGASALGLAVRNAVD